jgi:hypothetical protein
MRSAAQITTTVDEYRELKERAQWQAARELTRLLERARRRGDEWYLWVERRERRQHAHDMRRADGKPAACPVPGCHEVKADLG